MRKHKNRSGKKVPHQHIKGQRMLDGLHAQLEKAVRSGSDTIAIGILRELIKLDMNRFDYHNLMGDLCLRGKDFGGAIEAFSKALQINSQHPDVYIGLGLALHEFKRFDGAAASFEIAALYDAKNHSALGYRALSLMELKQYDLAIDLLNRAVTIDPDEPTHYLSRGRLRTLMGKPDEALADYERAVSLRPENAAFRMGHAAQWYRLRNYQATLEAIDRLVEAGRADAVALNFRGAVLGDLGRFSESREAYDAAIAKDPGFLDAKFNKALNCLLLGDFQEGWPLYETRLKRLAEVSQRRFEGQRWTGAESLSGLTLLVHTEQGLGDVLQFSRYVLKVAALARQVVFEVPGPLLSLFAGLPANVQVVGLGESLPACDYYTPLLSLPMAFQTSLETIPADIISLTVNSNADFSDVLGQSDTSGLRVGVAWSGNASHTNDHNRSIGFDEFSVAIEDLSFSICLQKEFRDSDTASISAFPGLRVVSDQLRDMSDTAALIKQLDLVITVDTSVAHLAASLGKPTWILIPATPDFRWLLGREDSPWYPSVRLFRQKEAKDWKTPLRAIRSALAAIRSGVAQSQVDDLLFAAPAADTSAGNSFVSKTLNADSSVRV